MKTYDVYISDKMVGFVDAESDLVYNNDGNQSIGWLDKDLIFCANQKWHRIELNGLQATTYPVPVERKLNYSSGKMEVTYSKLTLR